MALLQREKSADSLLNNGARSEYVKRYQVYPVERRKPYKPDNKPITSDVPLDSETVSKRDFPEHPVQPRKAARPAEGNLKSEGKLDFTSSYKNEFHSVPTERRLPYKPVAEREELTAFDAQPSYREDYPEWKLPEKRNRVRTEWQPPGQPFHALSTNVTDFPQHHISPRVNYRPDNRPVQSEAPFEGNSDYNDTFREHALPPKLPRAKLEWTKPTEPLDDLTDYKLRFTEHQITPRQMQAKEVYEGPSTPMDTRTTQMDSFLGPIQPKRDSFRPDRQPLLSDAPFEDATTMNNDFRAHAVKPRERLAQKEYRPPSGNMDLMTSHATHFTGHESHKRDPIPRPGSSGLLRGSGDMMTRTTHQNDFVERPLEKRENLRPNENYVRPAEPMQSETTQKSDFYEHQAALTKSFRPNKMAVQSDVPLDDRTGYRDTFVPHKVTPRQMRQRPTHKPPSAQFEDRTTVRDSYQGPVQPKRDSFRPDRQPVMSDAPFEGFTTMNNDFRAFEVQPREQPEREIYQRPEGEMDLSTTHSTNYRPHYQARITATERPGSSGLLRGHGPMHTSTNYAGDFRQPPMVPRNLVKAKRDYHPPSAPMESTTTSKATFLEHSPQPRFTFRPQYEYRKPDVPIDDKTGYQDSFVQHAISPRQQRAKEVYEPSKAPLDSRTTANEAYTGPVLPKRESYKPDRDYVRSDEPINAETTSNTAFKAWPTQERFRHRQSEYVKPEGFMDLTTSNRESFKEVRGQRPVPVRLGSSHILQGSGAFDTSTSYGSEFMPKSLAERKIVKPENQYVPSGLPFSTQTEYRSAHIGYVAPKERSLKPDTNSDTLNQRDTGNPFRIKEHQDWRQMLNMAKA